MISRRLNRRVGVATSSASSPSHSSGPPNATRDSTHSEHGFRDEGRGPTGFTYDDRRIRAGFELPVTKSSDGLR